MVSAAVEDLREEALDAAAVARNGRVEKDEPRLLGSWGSWGNNNGHDAPPGRRGAGTGALTKLGLFLPRIAGFLTCKPYARD